MSACKEGSWNNPYPLEDPKASIYYTAFTERPKHLDPAQSYAANEALITMQILEPPLQYHYLKRPYTLEPLLAEELPLVEYLDKAQKPLAKGTDPQNIAYTRYRIRIKKGVHYQPHPAFATTKEGTYYYHQLEYVPSNTNLFSFKHTGSRELVADDFINEIKRLADPRYHSPIFSKMSAYIIGLKELREEIQAALKKGPVLDLRSFTLKGVQQEDPYTYTILTEGLYPQFMYWLAMPFFAPVPWEADHFYAQPGMAESNISLDWYPVGTGPFYLVENNPNARMLLKRNPLYRKDVYPTEGTPEDAANGLLKHAGEQLPFLDEVHFILEKESIPYWTKFLQGYYDASGLSSVAFDTAIASQTIHGATLSPQMQEKGIRLQTAVEPSFFYWSFNMLDPLVGGYSEKQKKLRRALSLAIDVQEYINIFNNGRAVLAASPIPQGIFGYEEAPSELVPMDIRIAEAKQLLKEAGYPGGIDPKTGHPLMVYFDAYVTSGPQDKAGFEWIRKQFKPLGIQVVIRATQYNRFQEKMRNGLGQIFFWGWAADYPDPENFLFLLYGPEGKAKYGGENAANYENPAFDALFLKMKSMENTPERAKIIQEMLAILKEDCPWIYGFYPNTYVLAHQWTDRGKINPMARNSVKYIFLDPEKRQEMRRLWNQPRFWPGLVVLAILGTVLFLVLRTVMLREQRPSLKRASL